MEHREERLPDVKSPAAEQIPGQPDSAWEMVNKYGTYEIQPTADTENEYPSIAQGLAKSEREALMRKRKAWKDTPPTE